MKNLERFSLQDLSTKRVVNGIYTRITDIFPAIAWKIHPNALQNKAKIKELKDKYKGKRCIIVANGASLKKTDLCKLQGEITFGLNRIYLLFASTEFRPTFYIAADNLFIDQYSQEISTLTIEKFINWDRKNLFHRNDPTFLFIKPKHVLKDYFGKDLTKPIVFGATVTFVAMQIAYYMGFQQVIIIGLDHDYFKNGIPNSLITQIQTSDITHFHSSYVGKGKKIKLPDLLRTEIDYSLARQAFEESGREILDATIDGKCTIFKKVSFDSIFQNRSEF
jgi:hypothetical protein